LDAVPEFLEETVAAIVAFVPRLVGALLILVVGWLVGAALAGIVRRVADGADLDQYVRGTPIGRTMRSSRAEDPVAGFLAGITKWFVIALSVLAAADVLAIPVLSAWIQTAVAYLPAFIAGLLVIVFGFIVADFVGDMITRTEAATETPYTSWFATGTRLFLYFTAIVIGLDTMGIDVEILFVFAEALAWGLAAALALGVGIAVGWGGHEYVSQNIGRWMGQAKQHTPTPQNSGSAATGDD
jgi:small-conductance mechanosensitive channel